MRYHFAPAVFVVLAGACASPPPPSAPVALDVPRMPASPIATKVSPEQARARADVDESGLPLPIYRDDPRWGDAEALVTAVVFMDLQCPHCGTVHEQLPKARETAAGTLRVVWKHFPLPSHPAARPAAEAAQGVYALAGGEAFRTFAGLVFAAPRGRIERQDFLQFAREVGVSDQATLARGLDGGTWASVVDRGRELGERLKLDGVPTVYLNGTKIGSADWMVPLATELGKARERQRQGVPLREIYGVMCQANWVTE